MIVVPVVSAASAASIYAHPELRGIDPKLWKTPERKEPESNPWLMAILFYFMCGGGE